MNGLVRISDYVAQWLASPFGHIDDRPWQVTQNAEAIIEAALEDLSEDYRIEGGIAIHRSALVESGAVLKRPIIIGEGCLVAAGGYLRGGVYLDSGCIIGPGCEAKTCFIFTGSKLAHLNFVGDSIVGQNVNIEAGAVVANYRNELEEKAIRLLLGGKIVETGVEKFGALIGDQVRVGANAVIAPGAILHPASKVPRLALIDQHPDAASGRRAG